MVDPMSWPFVGRESEIAAFDEALADERCHAFVLHGPNGVGKSHLAHVCRRRAEQAGHATGKAVTVSESPSAALASLAHLLPEDVGVDDPVALFRRTRDALTDTVGPGAQRPGRRRRFVLLADDLDGLDEASAGLAGQLLEAGALFLLGVVTSLRAVKPVAYSLLAGEPARRIDLEGLSEADVGAAMRGALDGPVEPRTVTMMHKVSEGNPRYLREFVVCSLSSGALADDGESWALVSEVGSTPLLEGLLERRLVGVTPSARSVLNRIALCQPVDASSLPDDATDELESLGFVRTNREGRRHSVTLRHPAHQVVLQLAIPSSERRRILEKEAALIRSRGARRCTDKIRIASWQLAATGSADPETLLRAAELARRDQKFRQVCDFAEAACRLGEDFRPRLLLAESLLEIGELTGAEEAFGEAAKRAVHERDLLLVALGRCRLFAWGVIDAERALETVAEAMREIREPRHRAVLTAARGAVLMAFGRPAETLHALRDLAFAGDPHVGIIGKGPRAAALVATGRVADGLELAREAYEDRVTFEDSPAIPHPVQYLNTLMFALEEGGRLEEAYRTGHKGWGEALADDAAGAEAWIAAALARCSLLRGRPGDAERWASQAASVAGRNSLRGTLHMALARKAEAAAVRGDVATAQRALSECAGLPDWGAFRSELPAGRAWSAVAQGRVQEGRELLWEAAASARTAGHLASEARLLTDIARLGDAKGALPRLRDISGDMDGDLFAARLSYVEALAGADPSGLLDSARSLERTGSLLVAAEAAASAAVHWGNKGEQRQAAAAENFSNSLRRHCQGASSPGLAVLGAARHLTRREAEIAELVCAGLSNAEAAEALTLSKRTVDNHLQNIYRKLGVRSRRTLKEEYLRGRGN
ncbi:LuxR C-terminal-related transcriptional regulator [Streptomyces winkii]|uniref:LuxR C-terminal-related transcriptional regulator n=1 Tax=Streptomyces winkii TaxID=3051178 RepID=UPI0028D28358|nr:LuxR C-terminal-related transcriptional regulator [Streptomyces sp. DSM 40971]